ncbi:MAG: IS110 family transposase [Gammaproteobacteria bacterium]|nr:IS110 family transposase [Gammaproteobacteria bacterium]MDH5262571.1 IS110 family transposase [Gammaproteobacteria bacterium]MDH5584033.1 IS110 family transposase [Gammaproteobacteria bacterium]
MQTELSQYTAVIGIDWADKKHDVCVQDMATGKRRAGQVRHRAEDLDEWARSLHRRFDGPIAIAAELSKGPIINVLQKYDFFVIYPIDPSKLANHRKTFTTSGAKDDPTDAEFALDLLSKHTEHFKPLQPQGVGMRTLMTLVEHRRQLMNDRVRITNRLRNALKQYYPQPLEWFDRIDTVLFCDFIRRWPSQPQARRARRATIERFFREHNMNRKPLLERRIKAIKSAMPLTTDDAVVVSHRLRALALVAQLEVTLQCIKQYDAEIASLAPEHPDYELFSPLPGAGPVHTPRLMVAFGEQRERFNNAAEVQKYGGLAPVTKRSGQSTWIHWRWQCPTFLRQTFVEWSAQTINKSYWAGLYYQQQRSKGCSHQAAVRALAFKWIRILYRCWKTRTPYDESRYLRALQERGSPLLKTAEAA